MNSKYFLVMMIVTLLLVGCEISIDKKTDENSVAEAVNTDQVAFNCDSGTGRLEAAIADQHRRASNTARDDYRHPLEVMRFFDVQPHHHVVEIWPSGGWWTEIITPYVRDCGQYTAAGYSLQANRTPGWRKRIQRDYNAWLAADPERFDQVKVTDLSIPERPEIAAPGSADRVLTFRNVHNWMNGEYAPQVFSSIFTALKPGGLLGLVEHRAEVLTPYEQMLTSGYVTEAYVIAMAKAAGFELVERSEINANPKDSKDHPQGVWSLPPSYRGGEATQEQYRAIGESDRMTLLFRKP